MDMEEHQQMINEFAAEMNNVLTGITGNISLALMYKQSEADVEKYLKIAEEFCFRAAALTKGLFTFFEDGSS